jgi:hypothetical protein
MLASPVGLIVPLVSTTTFVSSRMTLEAQETKVRVASLFLRHGILFGLRRMPCLLLLYLLTFQVIRCKKKKGCSKSSWQLNGQLPSIRFGQNSVPATSYLR